MILGISNTVSIICIGNSNGWLHRVCIDKALIKRNRFGLHRRDIREQTTDGKIKDDSCVYKGSGDLLVDGIILNLQ